MWDEGRTKSGTEYQEIGQEALGGNDTKPKAKCRGVGRVVLWEDKYEESEDGQKNAGPDAPWENKGARKMCCLGTLCQILLTPSPPFAEYGTCAAPCINDLSNCSSIT